jgi:hypothetical protein
MKLDYTDLAAVKAKCKPDGRTIEEWVRWVEHMIGSSEKYDRYVIKDNGSNVNGMNLTGNGWCTSFDSARRYSWKDTAIFITDNRRLEAIRFIDGIATDSKGVIIGAE